MKASKQRPTLLLDIDPLGRVDPFRLELVEDPPDSGAFVLRNGDASVPLNRAGLHLMGAANALCELLAGWTDRMGGEVGSVPNLGPAPVPGAVHFILRPREAPLLASLLKRHLARLPEPPPWMVDLHRGLEEVQVLLQWAR